MKPGKLPVEGAQKREQRKRRKPVRLRKFDKITEKKRFFERWEETPSNVS